MVALVRRAGIYWTPRPSGRPSDRSVARGPVPGGRYWHVDGRLPQPRDPVMARWAARTYAPNRRAPLARFLRPGWRVWADVGRRAGVTADGVGTLRVWVRVREDAVPAGVSQVYVVPPARVRRQRRWRPYHRAWDAWDYARQCARPQGAPYTRAPGRRLPVVLCWRQGVLAESRIPR